MLVTGVIIELNEMKSGMRREAKHMGVVACQLLLQIILINAFFTATEIVEMNFLRIHIEEVTDHRIKSVLIQKNNQV